MDNDANKNTEGKIRPTDNSGKTVPGIDQVLKYDYNEKGKRTSLERDNNVDGKFDYREVYTLDVNGRQTAKEIDLTNDGKFDRKEAYTKEADDGLVQTHFYNLVDDKEVLTKIENYELNANNQRIHLLTDVFGDGSSINGVSYELDEYGRVAKAYFDMANDDVIDRIETYTRNSNGAVTQIVKTDSQGKITEIQDRELDALNRITKYTYDYTGDGQPNRIVEQKFNQWNLVSEQFTDRTGNGLTNDDIIYVREYNPQGQIAIQKGINPVTNKTVSVTYMEYDETGFTTVNKNDIDLDGKISSARDRIVLFTQDPVSGSKNGETVYDGTNKLLHKEFVERDNNGIITLTFRDNFNDGTIERMEFGNYTGQYTKNHAEDLTNWTPERIDYIKGLNLIMLSSASFESTLTLDRETIAKIAPANNSIRIMNGDANDTVNLLGFTQSETSSRVGHNQYTTDIDGTTYIVHVNDGTEVILG
ncbi:hypothetical protein ACERCG_09590 [Mannheimia sp. E30BD]